MPNSSTPIDIRVHENVNVTLDCGHFVIPSLERRNLNTIWKLRRRKFNGDLESDDLVFIPGTPRYSVIFLIVFIPIDFCSDGIEIFGANGRFLHVANPRLASRIEQSNVGEFTCEYDEHNIYKADINIIGM